ncbi:hypothetical protein KG091_00165 [Carnobacteriaceae bacterium zg-ZUI78]|nr:hypothetical protein [Carnobacteriaceae bacterium zg-ZUI78]
MRKLNSDYMNFYQKLLEFDTKDNLSLVSGVAGQIILLKHLRVNKLITDIEYKQFINRYMQKISLNIESMMYAGLWTGISGVGLALHYLNDNSSSEFLNKITITVENFLEEFLTEKKETYFLCEMDIINGISGCVIFLYKVSKNKKILEKSIEFILSKLIEFKKYYENNIFYEVFLKMKNNYDLGIAHGIPGFMLVSMKFYHITENMDTKRKIKEVLMFILTLFDENKKYYKNIIYWNGVLSAFEKNEKAYLFDGIDVSWCYGLLGHTHFLIESYKFLNKYEEYQMISQNFIDLFTVLDDYIDKFELIVCHGIGSVFYYILKVNYKNDILLKKYKAYFFKRFSSFICKKNIDFDLLVGDLGIGIVSLSLLCEKTFLGDDILFP